MTALVMVDGVEQEYVRPIPPWVARAKEQANSAELMLWQALDEIGGHVDVERV